MAIAAVNNMLVLRREDIDLALRRAEQTAVGDHRREELSAANRDAIAFAPRLLALANTSAADGVTPPFSELARMVGATEAPYRDQR